MENFPTIVQSLGRLPETKEDAIRHLMSVLEDTVKATIAEMDKEDLVFLHFTLGIAIRNALGLHRSDSPLLADCGGGNPDDASLDIINGLWTRVREH